MLRTPIGRSRLVLIASALAAIAAVLATGAFTASAEEHHTLYVSASKGNDANPCTSSKPCKTIGHAVSVASPGGHIKVKKGTYNEQVDITKKLDLEGNHATIDATGQINGINISGDGAEGSKVKGFTVLNATGEGILAESTSHVTIEENVLRHNDLGEGTSATPECAPNGNIPGDCGEALHLTGVTWSLVEDNTVEENVGGILITDETGPSHNNLIVANVIRNNALDCGITLPSHNPLAVSDPSKGGVYDNAIIRNRSEHNGGAGVGMFAPFPGAASYDNRVEGNTLTGNGEAGVAIHGHAPGQNVGENEIIDNTIADNGVDPDAGSGNPVGIALLSVDPTKVTVRDNEIKDEFWGIFTNGPITIEGLSTNEFAASVTHHTN